MNFEFEKQGIKFFFRNPTWDNQLNFEYKVSGTKENSKNDGYFYNSSFMPNQKALNLNNVKINGKNVAGVGLPENILTQVQNLYTQLKNEDLQKKLNSDIPYTLNDTTSYGIYNGISQFDIETIISNIKKENNSNVFLLAEDIAKILNKDEELKQIAIDSYQPNPEGNWNEEYMTWFRSAASKKEAPGHGMIPNQIIKEKITNIVVEKTTKENNSKQAEEIRVNNLFELAKQTGEKQLISKWMENCNDPKEECSTDLCCLWAMPDGNKKVTRNHTW